MSNISSMVGKTFTKVTNKDDEELIFENEHEKFVFLHDQECCESVTIEDIVGDLQDLVGTPITFAEESANASDDENCACTCTWTFYKFATVKGWVDVRWLGVSNGYYSEKVDLAEYLYKDNEWIQV